MDSIAPSVIVEDLGLVPYQKAWDHQSAVQQQLIQRKRKNRNLSDAEKVRQTHHLIFCEHPPVYTLGKSGSMSNLLITESQLKTRNIEFYKINRGGDITFHGPGQIVGYPIFDLDEFFTDIHRYVRSIEQVIMATMAEFGIEGIRIKEYTGVWIEACKDRPRRKICAIGVHLSRWVTLHGFAFNINTDLGYFKQIIPCGITEKDMAVTSLQEELGDVVDTGQVKKTLTKHFAEIFKFDVMPTGQ